MSEHGVKRLLFLAILVVSVLPLLAALYLLDSSLQTSLNLGFNAQVARAFEEGSQNLKTLRTLDPERQALYRRQFDSLQELRHVYSNPEVIRRSILDSLRIYFAGGIVAAVLFSVFVAALLGRRIAHAYKQTFDELIGQREKVRYLQEMSSWQELAKVLAHEIKNPLTPIEVLVSSLDKSYRTSSAAEFAAHLRNTQVMIAEELHHLKSTVNKFSDFARLPSVQTARVELRDALADCLRAIATTFESAQIELTFADAEPLPVDIDATLFRQILANIVRNGVEANPGARVRFDIRVTSTPAAVQIEVGNDGAPVPAELAARIFDPYVSGKSTQHNMGLGLAIVRKIVIEHGGDIRYEPRQDHPVFVISLPRTLA
jgi:signal transduction histidine kinase